MENKFEKNNQQNQLNQFKNQQNQFKNEKITQINILEHIKKKNRNKVVLIDQNRFTMFPHVFSDCEKEENLFPILIRQQTQILIKKIKNNGRGESILIGSSGAGKSFILFHSAIFFSYLKNWIVLYIPNTEELLKMEEFEAAKQILKDIWNRYGTWFFDSLSEKERNDLNISLSTNLLTEDQKKFLIEKCKQVIYALKTGSFKEYHKLIIVDEWNALWNEKPPKKHFLNKFKNFYTNSNVFLLMAISSKFQTFGKFDVLDFPIIYREVYVYNEEEFESILENYKSLKKLPNDFPKQDLEKITGRVPRVLFFISIAFQNRNEQINWLEDAKQKTKNHYQEIVWKVFQKIEQRKSQKLYKDRNALAFIKRVFLNKSVGDLPKIWKVAGLFQGYSKIGFSPICEWVFEAISEYIYREFPQIIELLTLFYEIRFYSLGLYVGSIFYSGFLTFIDLPNVDLAGNLRSHNSFHIGVSSQILQNKNEKIKQLNPGTLIRCFGDHPVVDFIIYSLNKQLFYIQISPEYYPNHSPKIDPLFTKTIKEYENQTIIEYYSNLTNMKLSTEKDKLPENQFYVYITNHQIYFPKKEFINQPVILVNKERLSHLNPELWNYISGNFDK
ncbi:MITOCHONDRIAL 28S ribosomal protein S29 [Anaeramoeba ignava]|uniref:MITOCHONDRIAL 28S ribosomal protein S29 n=1 Tax=Anaeramoeba ignava TaxID=1746090 RepID=A0A9Q0LS67_ANAIG|nr:MITOCHONDRIAL 28S ribosomal protein S29 [Anaeramoeba ignava]